MTSPAIGKRAMRTIGLQPPAPVRHSAPTSLDQRAVIAWLATPAAYGAGIDTVDRIDTHSSVIFLAGDRAYKLKRAVRYDYLDYSTPALQGHSYSGKPSRRFAGEMPEPCTTASHTSTSHSRFCDAQRDRRSRIDKVAVQPLASICSGCVRN